MRYECSLSGLKFTAFHGLYEEEKLLGGKFMVDVSLITETDDKSEMKNLAQVMNYEEIHRIVKHEMEEEKHELLEALAVRIINRLESAFEFADEIRVAIHKPNPAGLFGSGKASVQLCKKVR